MLKLKLQCFGQLMQKAYSLEMTLMLAKIEGRRRRGWQRMRWLDGITTSMVTSWASCGRWWRTGKLGLLQSMGLYRVGHDWETEQQQCTQYTELINCLWNNLTFSILKVYEKHIWKEYSTRTLFKNPWKQILWFAQSMLGWKKKKDKFSYLTELRRQWQQSK